MCQPDIYVIQDPLAQATEVARGSERGGAKKDNKDDGGSNLKVSEG